MPFTEDGGFDAHGAGKEEGAPAAGEGVAVDVDEEFGGELFGEGCFWDFVDDFFDKAALLVGHAPDDFREASVGVVADVGFGVEGGGVVFGDCAFGGLVLGVDLGRWDLDFLGGGDKDRVGFMGFGKHARVCH